ncbi:CHAD domain-containing protein [Bradyrhizobium yuanmingense]|uniref:CYTH and CHAD domain-containing protein n=1 Tax=Bradyrhizobium yuanmingense TaxID=108015 RepID=UPI0023B92C7F|nr:CYTH and CHAD domain-containing protein [Bradyrhizobium yuanmingense]MDF0521570.1 CHAD domain-containing protein [Bradyrhizobium yuanmingense]
MGLEAELKFHIPHRALKQVEHGRLPGTKLGCPAEADLLSTYFDTPRHKLKRHGLSLRVRHDRKTYVQTVKSETDGRFGRGEWETLIESGTPDLTKLNGSPVEAFSSKKLRQKLKPIFKTSVHRVTLPIQRKGSEIELAIDRGKIMVGHRSEPVDEVEIELKRGKPRDLFETADALARRTEAELYLRSKAERGYDLADGQVNPVSFAAPIKLDKRMEASDAFRIVARSAIRHFVGNADAVRDHNPEGVHEMRVGLRRLRAAISLFSKLLPKSSTENVKRELKWLTGELAAARELDVFLNQTIRPAARDVIPRRGIAAVKQEFTRRRAEAFERASSALDSKRFRTLLLDVVEWVEMAHHGSGGHTPIRKFAATVLVRRIQKIQKDGKQLEELSARARHRLRIRIKKVRYAARFFESLFTSRGQRKRLAQLEKHSKKLQDALGAVNDYLAHREMALDAALNAPPHNRRARAFASGVLVGREDQAARPLLRAARKRVSRLRAL